MDKQFTQSEQALLLTLAREALHYAVEYSQSLTVKLTDYPTSLRATACCFVTLTIDGALRGCIGSLEAYRPLVVDVAAHAYAAACRDYRFSPLQRDELPRTEIEISVLTPQTPISCQSESDLLDQLQPGIDGLTLKDGTHHATFLPSVWEQLPDKPAFLAALKNKAGLPRDYWSDSLQAFRYRTQSFAELSPSQ